MVVLPVHGLRTQIHFCLLWDFLIYSGMEYRAGAHQANCDVVHWVNHELMQVNGPYLKYKEP